MKKGYFKYTGLVLVVLIFAMVLFYLGPLFKTKVNEAYLTIDSFKFSSLNVYVFSITFLIFCIPLLLISNLLKLIKTRVLRITIIVMGFLLFSFVFNSFLVNAALYANTFFTKKEFKKKYKIIKHEPNNIFHLMADDNEIIMFKGDLQKINAQVQKTKYKSVFDLYHDETISLHYYQGFLNIKLLKNEI